MFRNYKKDNEETNIVDNLKITELTDIITEQLDEMKTPLEIKDIDVSTLAPRKVDFDLKRNIASKLKKLEKKTALSISEIIRMRIKGEESNLLANVNLAQETNKTSRQDVDSD